MASIWWSVMLWNTGQGITCRRLPSTGGGMQFAGVGGFAEVQVGWRLSKSLPVLRIVLNCSRVRPPSGSPVLSGVKLRVMMLGPTYPPYSGGGYEVGMGGVAHG